ncbi:TIGR00269 family protein [Methanotorris formicicus]|uniref:PP-loop domain protein n=1 Tax=Methanotorris formicicus Mc-S-70 TaxID=647171 RepID=H1KY62_9EURY|nr:TIGR00269 family protein [Methanotorris formicicus]EHP87422.1 PP-loop domain protein [Methanotorris formicicus Mc-S-70]
MKCSKCGSKAIYHQKYSGLYLCKECFIKDVERKVRKSLGKKIIKNNMKIGVGLSGGKDSVVMTYILNKFFETIPNSEIVVFFVDEGIKGFREVARKFVIEFCERYDIKYKIIPLKEELGITLDDIVKIAREKNITLNPCSFCGVMRRKLLNKYALKEGCNYLAIGHNLDDISQAIMMNYIDGSIEKLVRLGKDAEHPLLVKRIRPLKYIPEEEVQLYADLVGLKYQKEPCPYSSISYRAEISEIIDKLEDSHPGTRHSIVSGFEKLIKHLDIKMEVKTCKICGEPSSGDICKVCLWMEKLGLRV